MNLEPTDYESAALTAELRARVCRAERIALRGERHSTSRTAVVTEREVPQAPSASGTVAVGRLDHAETARMDAPLKLLSEEHRNMALLLDALDQQIDVFAACGTPDYELILGAVDYFVHCPDRCIHPREGEIAAWLLAARRVEAAVTDELSNEHRALSESARRLRHLLDELLGDTDIARDTVVDAARSFIDLERKHLRWEEDNLFAPAARALGAAEWRELEKRFGQAPEVAIAASFRAFRERLLAWSAEDAQAAASASP